MDVHPDQLDKDGPPLNFLFRVWCGCKGLPTKLTRGNPDFGLDCRNKNKKKIKSCLCRSKMRRLAIISGIISKSDLRRPDQIATELTGGFLIRRNPADSIGLGVWVLQNSREHHSRVVDPPGELAFLGPK